MRAVNEKLAACGLSNDAPLELSFVAGGRRYTCQLTLEPTARPPARLEPSGEHDTQRMRRASQTGDLWSIPHIS